MAAIDEILKLNSGFTPRHEDASGVVAASRELCVLACSDPGLTRVLEPALGLDPGEAVILRVPGPTVSEAGPGILGAVAGALFINGCAEILVVAHTGCGVVSRDARKIVDSLSRRGVSRDAIPSDLRSFFGLAPDPRNIALGTAAVLRALPFLPRNVVVHAALLDTGTGRLTVLERGESAAVARPAASSSFTSGSADYGTVPADLGIGARSSLDGNRSDGGAGVGSALQGAIDFVAAGPAFAPLPLNMPVGVIGASPAGETAATDTRTTSRRAAVSPSSPAERLESSFFDEAGRSSSQEARPKPPPLRGSKKAKGARPPTRTSGQLPPSALIVSSELAAHVEKVRAFYAAELGPQVRGEVRKQLFRAHEEQADSAELIKIVIRPILESGQKRYKVIDELLALKDALSKSDRNACHATLRQLLD